MLFCFNCILFVFCFSVINFDIYIVGTILDPGGYNGLHIKSNNKNKNSDTENEHVYRSVAESITLVILYLLDDPKSRAYLRPYVDLKNILAPFFDVDTDNEKIASQRRMHAKNAIVCMMRSWAGIVLLTSDADCLPRLVSLIESKVNEAVKVDLIECITELFEPLVSKVTPSLIRLKRDRQQYYHKPSSQYNRRSKAMSPTHSGDPDEFLDYDQFDSFNDGLNAVDDRNTSRAKKKGGTGINLKSLWNKAGDKISSSPPHTTITMSLDESAHDDSGLVQTRRRTRSISSAVMNVAKSALPSKSRQSQDDTYTSNSQHKEKSTFSLGLQSLLKGGMNKDKSKDKEKHKDKINAVSPQKQDNKEFQYATVGGQEARRAKYDKRSSVPPSAFLLNDFNKDLLAEDSPAKNLFPHDDPVQAAEHEMMLMMNDYSADEDVVYNMMDSYSAILCSAFMHCKLLECLCEVGTHASGTLAKKSRELLVNLLRIASGVYSESMCSELLALPKLMRYSTSAGTKSFPDLAHKATDILNSLADVFSTAAHLDWQNDVRFKTDKADPTTAKNAIITKEDETARDINGVYIPSFLGSRVTKSSLVANGRTILQLASDVRKHSFTLKAAALIGDLPIELFTSIVAEMKHSHFSKLMELTKVSTMKDEPLKWDWTIIGELLESGFPKGLPERVNEALKNKFFKRILAFFRCSRQVDKSMFPNLYWEPENFHLLECMCLLNELLMTHNVVIVPSQKDQKKKVITGASKSKSEGDSIFTDLQRELTNILHSSQQRAKMMYPSSSSSSSSSLSTSLALFGSKTSSPVLSSTTFGTRNFYKRESKLEKEARERERSTQEENRSRHNVSVLSSIDFGSNHGRNDSSSSGSGASGGVDGDYNPSFPTRDVNGSFASTCNLLQRRACIQRMVREYFVLIGRLYAEYYEV